MHIPVVFIHVTNTLKPELTQTMGNSILDVIAEYAELHRKGVKAETGDNDVNCRGTYKFNWGHVFWGGLMLAQLYLVTKA